MAITYELKIDGVVQAIRGGWSIDSTAQGRDTLSCEVDSLDGTNRFDLDDPVTMTEAVSVVSSSAANPTVITTLEDHGLVTGQNVDIAGHSGSTPAVSGTYRATRTGAKTFTVPVHVTVAGAGGTAARRIFGGTVDQPDEAGFGGSSGSDAITTRISAVDPNAVSERRFAYGVFPAESVADRVARIATYLADHGVTVHPDQATGPTLIEQRYDDKLIREVLDENAREAEMVYEFDGYYRLRMYAPSSEPAPVDVVDGNGVALGDITVAPKRSGYANRVIVRFTATAIAAYGYLGTGSGNFADGETVTLGPVTYTFTSPFVDAPNNVLVGATGEDSINNLVNAITGAGGAGSLYGTGTIVNGSATAFSDVPTRLKALAITPGAAGNSTAATTTSHDAAWTAEGGIPITTLVFGADAALTNRVIVEDVPSQAAPTYVWEAKIESPETTDYAAATTLGTAWLAVHLVTPRVVKYTTAALGLRPGQSQTINHARRNINSTCLITDVSTRNEIGQSVRRYVTAIDSLLLSSVDRWQDDMRSWSGGGSSGSSAVAVSGGGGTVIVGASAVYFFGGSNTEWQQTSAGGWVDANSIELEIDTVARGSTEATFYVRVRSQAGSVTVRLRNVSDGVTVGAMAVARTQTGFTVTDSFSVSLTPGRKKYRVQLSPSVDDTDIQMGSGFLE